MMNLKDQFYEEKSLLSSTCLKCYTGILWIGVYENIKRQFINIVPIKAYIRKLFFKSRLCSWSGFISCSNFRINILGKDVLDLYGLGFKIEFNLIIQKTKFCHFCFHKMSRIFAIELVGPQKFELTETIQEASWF